MSAKAKLLIIDGNALIHRSFHALPPLTTKHGELVNAVFGFTSSLLKAWKEVKPTHIVATFDLKGPTFRDEMFKDYKATRVKAPDELYAQIPKVKEVVRSFNIPIYEQSGFEADDVIGTIVKQEPQSEKVILTGDMDTMQLVDDRTKVFTMRKGLSDTAIYDERGVKERYGLRPDQIVDYKALRGDASDNIPGVKGIGEKTATDLLQQFETLEDLYKALADETKKAKELKESVRAKLIEHKKDAFMSQKLAQIAQHVPIKFNLNQAAIKHFNRDQVVQMFQELGFKSLLSKLPDVTAAKAKQAAMAFDLKSPVPKRANQDYHLVDDTDKFKIFLVELKKQDAFVIDTETTSLNIWEAKLLGMSFCWEKGKAWYVKAEVDFVDELRPILENHQIKKYGHNLKYDAEVLRMHGVDLRPLAFDSMVASYLLNSGTRQHSLDALAFAEFGYEMMPIEALIGPPGRAGSGSAGKGKNQISMADVAIDKLAWYSCEDADFTWRLVKHFEPQLVKRDILGLMDKMEMPLIEVIMDMEIAGIKVDVGFLRAMSRRVKTRLNQLEERIYKYAGHQFNISSPLQLKEVLFETLKISTEGLGKTKTGVSTAADELLKMKDAHPIVPLISEYREISKLISTYLDALPELVNQKTERVHTSFNQTVTATGRLSSSDPNLQNIPIRTELGAEIRKAFIAERGFRLLSADYSQIELRIIASMAKDEAMIASFKKGEDIHARTAANINDVPLDKVTKQMRRAAKAVNFGIIYGLGYVGLSMSEGISREEARMFIDKYFAIHQHIKAWIENTKKLAHQKGFVETLFGRRRYFPEINSGNQMLVAQAERMAVNSPIQGTAADLIKLAMITVHADLHKISPKSRLLLQVHDELVVEVPLDDVEKVKRFLTETMENVYKLSVPIEVDVGEGLNWGETKS